VEEQHALRDLRIGASDRTSEVQARVRHIREQQSQRLRDALTLDSHLTLWPPIVTLSEFPLNLPLPPATDRSFWWAISHIFAESPYTATFLNDGIHLGGKLTHTTGDLIFRTIWASALFEIQSARIPPSSIHAWDSSPRIELFGEVVGHVPEGDIFSGDLWSKCWLHLRQTVFQYGFGPDGPVRILRGEASRSFDLIFIENVAGMRVSHMPGSMLMPSLAVTGVNTADSLWSELHVQLDIQLEGDGSLIWLDPELILRTFQWPLNPL
jgi:hypothetical protein